MGRMLRHLASNGYINTAGTDRYVPTNFTRAITNPTIGSGIQFMHDTSTLPLARLPEFMRRTGYGDPRDKKDSPWTFGMQTEKDHFPWLNEHPDILQSFANHMSGYAEGRPLWMDLYPVKDRLTEGFVGDTPFIVDVGGSIGHDLSRLLERFPDLPGRCILQDQAPVIREAIGLDKQIEPMPHDFFTPQPVKGARAYFLHSILHDWPDDMAVKILLNLEGAMTAGYSKVIINENIIPPDAAPVSTALDLVMMILNTSSERTQAQWEELLGKAGLKVTGVWSPEGGESQGVIEAELA